MAVRALGFLFLSGCLAGSLDANSRPAVIPMLSELPTDPVKRDAILDQSGDTTGPEHGKSLTKKERKVVTTAAFAAAIVGQMFSKTQNITLGAATTIDENDLGPKPAPTRPAAPDPDAPAPTVLVPWVPLH